jgi:hypothetical protein
MNRVVNMPNRTTGTRKSVKVNRTERVTALFLNDGNDAG